MRRWSTASILRPDSGRVEVCGADAIANPFAAKRLAAWLPDEPMLYDKLTPLEYLAFVAGLWNVPHADGAERAGALLRRLGMWEQRGHRCEGFSGGMKQKVALAGALIHEPRLLAFIAPADAGIVIVCAIAGAASTALVNVWRPQPARRSAMHRRHAQSKMMALVEQLLAILSCMTPLLALQDKIAWTAMAGAAILTLWPMRPERRRAQSRLANPVRGH